MNNTVKLDLNGINLTGLNIKPTDVFNINAGQTLMKSTDYSKLSLHEQILLRPGMYIGSISKNVRVDRILKIEPEGKINFMEVEMDYPLGCERTFLEILYNATDNVINSREKNHPIGEIEISMDKHYVKVRNGGVPIPVEMHASHGMWTPSLIFGELLSSSNYTKVKRTGIGMNGYGAKLTDIFSKEFIVKVGDPYNKKEFYQKFSDNMFNKEAPIISDGYTGSPYVEITYKLDFERLGYTAEGYPDYVINLYAAYAAEAAFSSHVPIIFNGIKFQFKDIREFAKLIINDEEAKYLIHYEYPPGTEVKQVRIQNGTYVNMPVNPSIMPITEVCILDTPHESKVSSFVNSANTKQGGIHVEAVYDNIGGTIINNINNQVFGSKNEKKTASRKFTLTKSDLKRHMSVIVSCWLPEPDCGAQEKVKLFGYKVDNVEHNKVHIKIDEKVLKSIMNWELVNQLYIDLEGKIGKLNDSKTKRNKRLITGTIQDAYYAGTDKANKCILYRTEGKSALGYAYTMKSELTEEQMQYVGTSCERGKPMNIMDANLFKILKSKKYQELFEHLGLTEGMDYTKDENFNTLRYGTFAILTDADVDGKHITSLLLNIFYCRFRTLLQRPFIVLIRTPIVRVFKGKQVHKFYSIPEYNNWCKITPNFATWEHKYYKGLATSSDEEVADDARNPKVAYFVYDDNASDYMKLAFGKKMANERKKWIANYKLLDGIEEFTELPITQFIAHEAVQFAVVNLGRTIPRFDGLKEGQRKSLYVARMQWKDINGKTMKVNRFSMSVAEKTNYHYGEKSLIDTITRMSLGFPGTNNLHHFVPDGQFGTRNDDGNDAGDARYIKTKIDFWINHVYMPVDNNILKYIEDEGETIEPVVMFPIVPIFMINGALGIGTGSSTLIPNFNVIDIIESIKCLIGDTKLPKLIPYYNGFTGTVKLEHRNKVKHNNPSVVIELDGTISKSIHLEINDIIKDDNDDEDASKHKGRDNANITLSDIDTNDDGDIINDNGEVISDDVNNNAMLKVITSGVIEIIDAKKLIITEIPIGKSIKQVEIFLNKLKESKEIKDFKNLSKHSRPKFEVYGYGKYNTVEMLGLVKPFSMTNMVLLTEENRPVKFKDQYDLIKLWYEWRLPKYTERRNYIIQEKYNEIIKQQIKLKFTIALIEGTEKGYIPGKTVLIMKQKKQETLRQMAEMGIPPEYLNAVKGTHFLDDDGISKLQTKINKLVEDYNKLQNITATQMWLNDLEEFKSIYLKNYPQDKNRVVVYE